MQIDWFIGLQVALTAGLAAFAGLLATGMLQRRAVRTKGNIFSDTAGETSFLFDGDVLVDATPDARALLSLSANAGAPWPRLLAYLVPRFPGCETRLSQLSTDGQILLPSTNAPQPLFLRAEHRGGLTRITLIEAGRETHAANNDGITQQAVQDELATLRRAISQAPFLVWREDANGNVIWANTAYLAQASQLLEADTDITWPLPKLFHHSATAPNNRARLDQPGSAAHWFDVNRIADGDNHLHFATPIDAVMQAETALRDFMQTLTKTFAHLPIGLAIFDHQRQLQLFNPALLDLSGLPPDFLSLRPTLFAFLDAMRDRNMIPEPKDYRSWRKQMTDLEQAAASGLFEDTWSLPSGQTYRIIGRPHPNGALALMFEDISTEMSRIRRYRADLELGQAVVDSMDQALAVFSPTGILVMSNAAYLNLWGHDPLTKLSEGNITALCKHWRNQSAPSPFWAMAEDFVSSIADRDNIRGEARLLDGRLIECQFRSMPGGSSLVTFRIAAGNDGLMPSFATARTQKSA